MRYEKNGGQSTLLVFIKKLGHYSVFLIMLIIILVPILYTSYQQAKKSIIEQSTSQLAEGMRRVKSLVANTQELSGSLLSSKEFTGLLLLSGQPAPPNYMDFNIVQKKLSEWGQKQDFMLASYIVFKNNPIIISDSLILDNYNGDYITFFKEKATDAQIWHDEVFSNSYIYRFEQRQDVFSKKTEESVVLSINISNFTTIDNSCVLNVVLDSNKIIESIMLEETKVNGFLRISDKNGSILNYNYKSNEVVQYTDYSENVFIDQNEYILIGHLDSDLGIYAQLGIPVDLFKQNISSIIKLMVLYILIGIFVVFGVALYFAIRETMVLNSILKTASKHFSNDMTYKNEYQLIENAINSISTENQKNMTQIMLLNDSIKACLLENLFLLGAHTQTEEEEIWRYFGNKFEYYCIAKFDLRDVDGENLANVVMQIEASMKKTLQKQMVLLNPKPTDMIFVIFLEIEDFCDVKLIKQDISNVLRSLDENSPRVVTGLSNICTGVKNVHSAYMQALRSVSFNYGKGAGGVYQYDLTGSDLSKKIFDFAILLKLHDAIVAGELEAVEQLFEKINSFLEKFGFDVQEDLQIFFAVRHILDNSMREIIAFRKCDIDFNDIILPEYDAAISCSSSMENMFKVATRLCFIVTKAKESNNMQMKSDIISYIDASFADVNINAAQIAEVMDLSEKYIYQLVKEQTGKSLGKYIEDLRIEKAEELLIETTSSNKEITEMVGFGSESSFYRVFSKKHGVSPTKWKENQANSTI